MQYKRCFFRSDYRGFSLIFLQIINHVVLFNYLLHHENQVVGYVNCFSHTTNSNATRIRGRTGILQILLHTCTRPDP